MKNRINEAVSATQPSLVDKYQSPAQCKSRVAAIVAASLMTAPFALPAYAQENDKSINALMEEIVVTARKREEGVQDTPIAVSAFSGASMEARGIDKIDGIAALTPNMTFSNINTNGGGGSNAAIYIRGVGQTDFIPSADPGVGLYVDGVYLARSIGSVLDLIDVERIEVLRGPQGTLFGRNTIGGAVSIHTVKPHDEFEAKVRVKVGSDDRLDVVGKVNVPITDNLFVNATIASFNQDGFVENPITGVDTGDDDTLAFRGALRWQASDDLLIDINADYAKDRENGQPRVSTSDPSRAVSFIFPDTPTGTGNNGVRHNFFLGANSPFHPDNNPPFVLNGADIREFNACDATPANIEGTNDSCANSRTVGLGRNTGTDPTFSDADIWGVSATIDWSLSDTLQIKSITAYRDLDSSFAHDGDNSPFFLSFVRDEIFEQEQFSQEIQVLGTALDDRLDWIVGAYYFTEEGTNFNPVDFVGLDIESGGDFDHESKAAFVQATFDITEKLHLTAGVRYTEDTKDFIVKGLVQTAIPVFAPPFVGRVTLIENGTTTLEADDTTPMVNLAYDWTDGLMVYATYSEGFKSGGVQQRNTGQFGAQAPTYDPEFVDSYEAGFKYSSEGGNFVLNGAAFFSDYTDIQLETLAPGGIAPQLANSGDAELQGVELEMRWAPTASWFVEAAVGYIDAEIVEIDPFATARGGPAKGDTVPYVPEYNGSVSVIKVFDLGDMGILTPRVDYSYRDDVLFNADNNPGDSQDAYGLLNASVSWTSASEKYAVNLYFNNINDEDYITYTEIAGSSATGNDILGRGSEWYLSAEVRF